MEQQSETSNSSQKPPKGFFSAKYKKRIVVGSIIAIIGATVAFLFNYIFKTSKDNGDRPAYINTNNNENNNKVDVTVSPTISIKSKIDTSSRGKELSSTKNAIRHLSDSSKLSKNPSVNQRKNNTNRTQIAELQKSEQLHSVKNATTTHSGKPVKRNTEVKSDSVSKNKSHSNENTEHYQFKGYSVSEYPGEDEPILSIDSTTIKFDDYPINGAGIVFMTNCKDCKWIVSRNYNFSMEKGYMPTDTLEIHVSKTKLKELSVSYYSLISYRHYEYWIFDRAGIKYGPFPIKTTPGKTIIFYIGKKL